MYKVLIKTGYCTASDKNTNFLVVVTEKCLLFCTVAKVGNTVCTLILSTPYVHVHSSSRYNEITKMQGWVRKAPE